MNNKSFLKICYAFINRYITADELIDKLINMDKSNLDEKEINKIIEGIKVILDSTPNKMDEYVIKRKNDTKKMLEKLDKIPKDKELEGINKHVESLKKSANKEIDSQERWFKVFEFINNNDYFNNIFENLSDYELLELIASYICAPLPQSLSQEEFERIVKVGIENDEREWLWRLAFNYEKRNMNFDSIIDYFIQVKDVYYLSELISAIGEVLDIDVIIAKINDKELIKGLLDNKDVIEHYITDKQFKILEKKLEKI